jgi:DNA-binding CsgD family transcriptional regulator
VGDGLSSVDIPGAVQTIDYVRLALVIVNTLAFLALVIMSVRFGRREKYAWVRRLWTIVAIACGALLLGSIQRLALQAVSLGWLPESASEALTGDLQLIQSAVVLALIVGVFVILNRLADAIETSERVSASLLERVRHVDPKRLHLTNRESEVLAFIGQGVTTDSDLAVELHVSASTVQSHVKSLLRKAELHSRMDLIALAILVGSVGSGD